MPGFAGMGLFDGGDEFGEDGFVEDLQAGGEGAGVGGVEAGDLFDSL